MARDDKVVAITAAMPSGTGLDKVAEQFPDRMFDVGIAEQHVVTRARPCGASHGMLLGNADVEHPVMGKLLGNLVQAGALTGSRR